MTRDHPLARIHRLLGCLAVAYTTLVVVLLFTLAHAGIDHGWILRLWLGLATLCLFWPIVLVFHPGRSFARVLLPCLFLYALSTIASPRLSLWLNPKLQQFGFPAGFELSPNAVVQYAIGYLAGRAQARQEIRSGKVVLEGYGFGFMAPAAPPFSESMYKRYHVERRPLAGSAPNQWVLGHATGHNIVSVAELVRVYGPGLTKEAEDAEQYLRSEYDTGEELGRADARRDVATGQLAIEVFGPSGSLNRDYKAILHDQYNIELREVGNVTTIRSDQKILGHAQGYNDVARLEIDRRYGLKASQLVMEAEGKYSDFSLRPSAP